MLRAEPGDVILTRGTAWTSRLIRLGAALLDMPNIRNHVIVAHHYDAAGTLWGIEGRPGGVGWTDVHLDWRMAISNYHQPKTAAQRRTVIVGSERLLSTSYDWEAIADVTLKALRLDRLWHAKEFDESAQVPAHVICSSLADWLYERAGLPSPGGSGRTRTTTPADWDYFIESQGWTG